MKDVTHENIDDEVYENDLYKIEKMSLDEKLWHKSVFEFEIRNIYDKIRPNGMTCIHENEVKKTECNLIQDLLNPYKRNNILNSHHYRILHGCMNTRKGRSRFNNYCILLDSRCSSMIVIRGLKTKVNPIRDTVIQCHMTAGNITTNVKVKIYLPHLELSWKTRDVELSCAVVTLS